MFILSGNSQIQPKLQYENDGERILNAWHHGYIIST